MDVSESVRKSSYSVIPSYILDDEHLEDGAKLLYARLAMYSQEGRAWPSNAHLMEKHKACERTIQNWLKQLSERNYIQIDIYKKGFRTCRDIWITTDFKNNSTTRNPLRGRPETGCGVQTATHCTHISINPTNINHHQPYPSSSSPATDPKPQGLIDDDSLKMIEKKPAAVQPKLISKESIADQLLACGFTREVVDEGIRRMKANPKPITSQLKYLQTVCKKLQETSVEKPAEDEPETPASCHKKLAKAWDDWTAPYGRHVRIEASYSSVHFVIYKATGIKNYGVSYDLSDEEFEKQCKLGLETVRKAIYSLKVERSYVA